MLPFEIFNSQDIEKPWIVLINGLFATRQSWSASIPELARDYRVLSYDGRGQGEGPRPLGPYLLEDLVNDLAHLLF
ncbi:MAG: 3-oxoadipate enol-lactonase, partial [Bdellovibrio sp. CG12_big_fil_rev_8_21_14_0_65_39_13]